MVEPHRHRERSEAISIVWHAIAAGAPRPRNDGPIEPLRGSSGVIMPDCRGGLRVRSTDAVIGSDASAVSHDGGESEPGNFPLLPAVKFPCSLQDDSSRAYYGYVNTAEATKNMQKTKRSQRSAVHHSCGGVVGGRCKAANPMP
jgi:hypothetical protein